MKTIRARLLTCAALVLLAFSLFLGGCVNLVSTDSPATLPPGPAQPADGVKVTYNYTATGPVQLSANNLTLKVGERLVLQPAAGLTGNTRFTSSGEYFFSDVMKQITQEDSGRLVFEAIKPGRGKLQIVPGDGADTGRAIELWVTVQ